MAIIALVGSHDILTDLLLRALRQSPAVKRCTTVLEEDASLDERLAAERVDTVIYLAGSRSATGLPDPRDTELTLSACARADLAHLIVVSSSAACEPHHHQPGWVTESRLPLPRTGNAEAAAWLSLEERARQAVGAGETVLAILRPAPVPTADGRHTLPRLLNQRWAATPLGFDPSVQLLSKEDFVRGVERAVETRASGLFHLHPREAIPLRKALKAAGVARLPVPGSLLGLVRRPHLDYLRHTWTVGSERAAAELGFEARHSSAQALAKSPPLDSIAGPAAAGPAARDENHDAFGEERTYVDRLGKAFFPFLRKIYWRIEHEGIEHVPRRGRAVLTGVHRGFMPWDGVMALHLLARERQRYPRFLLHPCLLKFPFLAPYMTRLGGLLACQENADWVLQRDEILGIFPEGIRGAFTPYRRAYQLGRFGRDEYVRMALRNKAPILPFVTVGSAEIFPILGGFRWAWVKRWTEWPYLPVTASLPGIPNPSKWHTRFLEPLPVHLNHGPEAAEDTGLVRAISGEVQERMRQALDEMLARRRWIFFGSIFDSAVGPTSDATAGSAADSALPAALPGDPKA